MERVKRGNRDLDLPEVKLPRRNVTTALGTALGSLALLRCGGVPPNEGHDVSIGVNRSALQLFDAVDPRDYGFSDSASGSTNRLALEMAIAVACGFSSRSAMDMAQPPGSNVRAMRRPVVLPRGFFPLDAPWEIISCWYGMIVGAGSQETVLVLTTGSGAAPQECGLRLNGVGYFTFRDFSIRIDGDATYGIYCLKDTTSYGVYTRNFFEKITASGRYRTAAWRIGKPGSGNQEDFDCLIDCSAQGGGSTDPTYWQAGFYFGTSIYANNLIHMMYHCDSDSNAVGVFIDVTGVMIFGGAIQHNGTDIYITGPVSYFGVEGIRSEGSNRFLATGGGGTTALYPGSVRDCTYHAQNLAADGRFLQWNFSGALNLDNVHVSNWSGVGTSPRIFVSPTAGLTIDARGLSLDGTNLQDAVGTDQPTVATAIIRGYSKLTTNVVTTHVPGPTRIGAGKVQWSAFSTAPDVTLYRGAPNLLATDSGFQIGRALVLPTTTLNGPATVILDDSYSTVRCNASAGALTLGLPMASNCLGRIYRLKRVDSSSYAVTISAAGADTIDGAPSRSLSSQYVALTLQSNGAGWDIL